MSCQCRRLHSHLLYEIKIDIHKEPPPHFLPLSPSLLQAYYSTLVRVEAVAEQLAAECDSSSTAHALAHVLAAIRSPDSPAAEVVLVVKA